MSRLSTSFFEIITVTPKAVQYKLWGRGGTRLSAASRWHRHSQRPGQGNQEKRLLFYFFFSLFNFDRLFFCFCLVLVLSGADEPRAAITSWVNLENTSINTDFL